MQFKVGHGRRIRFWIDHWVCEDPIAQVFPDLFFVSLKQGASIDDCLNAKQQA